jgi:hypothetical protein
LLFPTHRTFNSHLTQPLSSIYTPINKKAQSSPLISSVTNSEPFQRRKKSVFKVPEEKRKEDLLRKSKNLELCNSPEALHLECRTSDSSLSVIGEGGYSQSLGLFYQLVSLRVQKPQFEKEHKQYMQNTRRHRPNGNLMKSPQHRSTQSVLFSPSTST